MELSSEIPASDIQSDVPPAEVTYAPGFIVSHQKLEIEVDFANQSIHGWTVISIIPDRRDLKEVRFHARQCEIIPRGVLVNGKQATADYENPYSRMDIPEYVAWNAEQYEMQKDKLKPLLQTRLVPGELAITIPRGVRIEDISNSFSDQASAVVKDRVPLSAVRSSSVAVNGVLPVSASTPILTPKTGEEAAPRFEPLTVKIQFRVRSFRDGLHWVGLEEGDLRYPHVYTRHSSLNGSASCIFPCLDDPAMRSTWEIIIKCSRTLGTALKRPPEPHTVDHVYGAKRHHETSGHLTVPNDEDVTLNGEDKLLEVNVICTGEQTDEISDPQDNSKKIVSFLCSTQVAARHIGFAVGPFEQVDLSEYRQDEENEKLGQKAVKVYGYCLPGRADELRNTCEALAFAIDFFTLTFSSYPFPPDFKVCFIEDQVANTVPLAGLSICSSRLLIPEDIIDPEYEVTRQLIHALASQWIGVSIIAKSRSDSWIVVGASFFMADLCMQKICGNNEYRFRQKSYADKLVELDVQRPSIYALGEIMHLGQFELDFMELKAPLVLFILDRRLTKLSGSFGLARILSRFLFNASTGDQLGEKVVATESFRRHCEKLGHQKLEAFFNQWVLGAGCPRFQVVQRFNKKRLTVEMTIKQTQDTLPTQRKLEKRAFLREFKEETHGVYAGDIQSVFTGQMTIRIHEADGTPYEHIVEIREGVQRIEIPYHTKYKRLKRSRREKERSTAGPGTDINTDNHDDVLLYCLGDVLQSREEVNQWGLVDWDPEIEQKMDQESYEWIRMDADFEWICEMSMNMPPYMYVSQLQQDRDVVAQQDSMLYLGKVQPHPLVSAILIRTLMDRRYFHGIREMAVKSLATHATRAHNWIGRVHLEKAFQEFFCYPGSTMPRSNDFSDKAQYLIKCAIPKAMARIRDDDGNCPVEARQFILDQLRFNDNGNNEFSDYYYVSTLLNAMADSLIQKKRDDNVSINLSFEEDQTQELQRFQKVAVEEIDRYRRMDEWIMSYHNIYTTTALTCEEKLVKAHIIPPNPSHFFAYTHDGTLDVVRVKALEALVNLGYLMNDSFLKYFLNIMTTDSSPYARAHCYQIFFLGLGSIALGEHKQGESPPLPEDGLLVDTDASLDAKREMIARTTSIVGALTALKREMGSNTILKQEIWTAVKSRDIGLWEQEDILEVCSMLYDAVESMVIRLKWPCYWTADYRGKGHLVFKRTNKIRRKPLPKPISRLSNTPLKGGHMLLTEAMTVNGLDSGSMRPPKRPSPPTGESFVPSRPTKVVKLMVGDRLRHFPHSIPSPTPTQPIAASTFSLSSSPSADLPAAPKMRVPLPGGRTPLPNSAPATQNEPSKKPPLKLRLSFGPKKL